MGFGGGITRTSAGTTPAGNDNLGPFPNVNAPFNEGVAATVIQVRVPPNAKTAAITVTTPGGTVQSTVVLTVA